MPIIRHTYKHLSAEHTTPLKSPFQINSGVNFTDLKEEAAISTESGKGFTISYEFTTTYGKDAAKIQVRGEVFYVATKDEAKDILEQWSAKKRLPEKTVLEVGNYCLMRAQMKAIELANDLNLQSPVQLPKFQAKK